MAMPSFRSLLNSGEPQLGLSVSYPAPGMLERIGSEWDWIWIDGQHGQFGYNELLGMVRACDLIQRPAFVRVPGHEAGPIGAALDMGATGIIVPCVDTPQQAHTLVQAARFTPLGQRSYGGRRPIDMRGRAYSNTANEDTLLVLQIETPQAIDNVEAIAAVPGVDALFLGPDDILLRRGQRMDVPRTRQMLRPDMEAVARACRNRGKTAVMVGVGAEMLEACLEMGFQMIVSGADVMFLAAGSRQALQEARDLVRRRSTTPQA
jgi:2-keto-3-deoxy-L-rhamnonate aldolase RhmA